MFCICVRAREQYQYIFITSFTEGLALVSDGVHFSKHGHGDKWMAGGDYDGDYVALSTDPLLVNLVQFTQAAVDVRPTILDQCDLLVLHNRSHI